MNNTQHPDAGDAAGHEDEAQVHPEDEAGLRVRTYERAGRTFVEAAGEVDLYTADMLRDAVFGACEAASTAPAPADGAPTVVVDLRGVDFLDSAGMALLARASTSFGGRCAVALVVAEGSHPGRVVRICGLDRHMAVAHSPEELLGEQPVAAE